MIPLVINFFRNLLFDELAAKRLARGGLLWAGSMLISITAYPLEVVATWGFYDWLQRLLGAAVLGAGGLVTAGQKNLSPEQIKDALEKLEQSRKEGGEPPASSK
jgi:hypothetical protein